MLLAAAQLESMNRPLTMPAPDVAQAAAANFRNDAPLMSVGPLDPAIGGFDEPTLVRKLDSVELDARTIDGVFEMYIIPFRNLYQSKMLIRFKVLQ